MREQRHSPSLLPYLAPGKSGINLEIALVSEDPSRLARHPFPFLLVADTDPLTRLIKAAFVTDSGSRIKDVFLLVQRDAYSIAANQLAPLTNTDIEDAWQKTYRYQSQPQHNSPLITLQQQLDKQGKLVPLEPLLFCTTTRAFFHPLCPACGVPLQLCSNDQLLTSLGLPQYSLSLNRYLFCPTCFSTSRETAFYAHHRSALDPPLVKDCAALAQAFGQLVQDRSEGTGLPCTACPESEECFGPAASSAPPIVPFSFYPFYLLISESMSMNGLDFVALLAGASPEELEARLRKTGESGRAAYLRASRRDRGTLRPFLFPEDARLFLEILYLKLSFLELIVTELFPDSGKGQPDPLLFADRIWVRLTDQAGLLPYLWSFDLHYLDLVRAPLDLPVHPPMPPAYAFHLLGLIWFTVLLTNSRQDVSEVQRAVENARRTLPNDPNIADSLMLEPAFFPENVFWNPLPFDLVESWRSFWVDALRIGWSLFQASAESGPSSFREELVRTIEHLRAGIQQEMFAESPAGKDFKRRTEAEAIHGILSRLMAKWRQAAVVQPEVEWEKTVALTPDLGFETTLPLGEGSATVPEDTAATVILPAPEPQEPTVPAIDEEIFQETVILSGKGVAQPFQPEVAPPPKAADELSETVILGATGVGGGREEKLPSALSPAASAEPNGTARTTGELAETVILTPSPRPQERDMTSGRGETSTPGEGAKEEILPETVILSPGSAPRTPPHPAPDQDLEHHEPEGAPIPLSESELREEAAAKKKKPDEEDELLSATIILSPSKDRDKK